MWVNDQTSTTGDTTTSSLNTLGLIAALILPSIALVCIAAAIAHLVMGWSVGHDASGREMIGGGAQLVAAARHLRDRAPGRDRRRLPLLPRRLRGHGPVRGGGAGHQGREGVDGRGVAAVDRARAPRFWPVLGTAVLMGVVSATLGNVLSFLPQGIVLAIGMESGWPVAALGSIIGQVVTTPFVAAATTLLYLDLRVRTEGIDIELAARRAIDRVA